MQPTTLLLVRHGATDSNLTKPPRLQGRTVDHSLSSTGREQARRTRELLASEPIAAVYSSPLLRARETALAIADPHRLPVGTIAEIAEVDVGQWEQKSWDEIARTEPEAYARFLADPEHHGYRGGENLAQVQARVVPAIRGCMAAHPSETIVIVAHNIVNRAFLAGVIGIPLARARTLLQANGCVNVVKLDRGELGVETMNSAFHVRGIEQVG